RNPGRRRRRIATALDGCRDGRQIAAAASAVTLEPERVFRRCRKGQRLTATGGTDETVVPARDGRRRGRKAELGVVGDGPGQADLAARGDDAGAVVAREADDRRVAAAAAADARAAVAVRHAL